jgi:hypothetical protein
MVWVKFLIKITVWTWTHRSSCTWKKYKWLIRMVKGDRENLIDTQWSYFCLAL